MSPLCGKKAEKCGDFFLLKKEKKCMEKKQ
jgi:hypothetical protein